MRKNFKFSKSIAYFYFTPELPLGFLKGSESSSRDRKCESGDEKIFTKSVDRGIFFRLNKV